MGGKDPPKSLEWERKREESKNSLRMNHSIHSLKCSIKILLKHATINFHKIIAENSVNSFKWNKISSFKLTFPTKHYSIYMEREFFKACYSGSNFC